MAYIAESYGEATARSAGQYNENFWLGIWEEGEEFSGSGNLISNADLTFNEVALCFARKMKHKDANRGVTDTLTVEELCECTRAVTADQRAAIAKKPASGGNAPTDYQNYKPCNKSVPKPNGLQLPPIDL